MASGGKSGHLNRLAVAKSPYLRQHATNPVDWYPFEKTALDKAKAENKVCRPSPRLTRGDIPVNWIQCLSLVSCSTPSLKRCNVQVMERESFENEQVADILNADFVSIKGCAKSFLV